MSKTLRAIAANDIAANTEAKYIFTWKLSRNKSWEKMRNEPTVGHKCDSDSIFYLQNINIPPYFWNQCVPSTYFNCGISNIMHAVLCRQVMLLKVT